MAKNLIIVESPAKAKTLSKYVGKDFTALASYGHVRDLIPKSGAVDPEKDFALHYTVVERNQRHVDAIVRAMKRCKALYLATDPDREGEAISWHVQEILKDRKVLDGKPIYRVAFNEFTKRAILNALENPRDLSNNLIDAQQARRALDFLVGFNLSPLLWKKIRRGLSAGRVQSPALRLIAEREEEIERFKTREYWSIEADLKEKNQDFVARLTYYRGEKLSQFSIGNQDQADEIEALISTSAAGSLTVGEIEKKQRRRNPAPPFTTSTLQQEASRKLGFSAQRTMRVAQQLYEGIDIGGETVGLITYMRTDAVSLANDAIDDLRGLIEQRYGRENLPSNAKIYKNKSKNAQEAHEAIRPSQVSLLPEELKSILDKDQFRLYDLIWKRTVACQMIHATLDTIAVNLNCGKDGVFRATGSTVVRAGFMAVYQEGRDDVVADDNGQALLPAMKSGQEISLRQLRKEQHFTEPPPRYTEASLVKTLEAHGIGRPSTYASIISTLQQREYVVLDRRRFHPTDVGRVVNRFLSKHFTQYVDYDFTARLEDDLDAISRGEREWKPVLSSFWESFKKLVDVKEKTVDRSEVTQQQMEEKCPKCGNNLSIRLGRHGNFIGCTAYPECDYTRNIDDDPNGINEPEVVPDRKCPKCQSDLVIKRGRYGKFIGCNAYPQCRHMEALEKPEDTGVNCPQCENGSILKRKSRRGKIFFSCSEYPKCDYALWNEPLNEPCPQCGHPLLTRKVTKRRGAEKVCPQKDCRFSDPIVEESTEEISV